MGLVETADIKKLLRDTELMSDIAKAVVADPDAMEGLAGDIADEMEDEIEDNPELRKLLVDAAMASPEFKKLLVAKLIKDLD